jgi:hypothetical protein
MIVRIGCRTRQPGLRSLDHLDRAIANDVVRRLAEMLRDRCWTVRRNSSMVEQEKHGRARRWPTAGLQSPPSHRRTLPSSPGYI